MPSAAEYVQDLQSDGRYHFTTEQAMEALKIKLPATRAALRRLKKKGWIADPRLSSYYPSFLSFSLLRGSILTPNSPTKTNISSVAAVAAEIPRLLQCWWNWKVCPPSVDSKTTPPRPVRMMVPSDNFRELVNIETV